MVNVVKICLETLNGCVPVEFFRKKVVFDYELVNIGICFPQIFETGPFLVVHFTPQVAFSGIQ
jgi:hypothetical protein